MKELKKQPEINRVGTACPAMIKKKKIFLSLLVIIALVLLLLNRIAVYSSQPNSDSITAVSEAIYPDIWTNGKYDSFEITLLQGSYKLGPKTLRCLECTLKEQAGLTFELTYENSINLANEQLEPPEDLISQLSQASEANVPTATIIVVNNPKLGCLASITYLNSSLEKLSQKWGIELSEKTWEEEGALAIITVNKSRLLERLFESQVIAHEFGHWMGIPARNFHNDNGHCTNPRCIMYSGPSNWDAAKVFQLIFANIFTGPPTRYCKYCAEELEEMKKRREINSREL